MTDEPGKKPTPTRAERAKRDARVLQLWLGGATYQAIATALDMTVSNVDKVVRREMAAAAKRRDTLADHALAVFVERTEALWKANFSAAMRGDYKAAVICDRVLARQARMYGLLDGGGGSASGGGRGEPDDPEPPLRGGDGDDDPDKDVPRLDDWRRRGIGT